MVGAALAAMLAGVSNELPERLYFTCKVTAPPSVTVAELYSVPPRDHSKVATDLFEHGLVSLLEPPPETWEVDRTQQLIKAGPGGWNWTFENAGFGTSEIRGSLTTSGGTYIFVTFNRISGAAETTIMRTDADSEAWRKNHGKPLPHEWTWKQQCTASQSPRF